MIPCKKCGVNFDDSIKQPKLHYHHIVPRFLGGKDIDGRMYLCEQCHKELHQIMAVWIKEKTMEWLKK